MLDKIVFDLETQKDFSEVGGRHGHHLLRVSLGCSYSYARDEYYFFDEKNIHKLGEQLAGADLVIGYNIRQFDYAVLAPYLNFSLRQIPTLDILEELEKILGHRIGLDAVASATLGAGKTGTGLNAIRLWREGRVEELKKYCQSDVRLTKEIYDYAQRNHRLLYRDFFEVREIPMIFPEPLPRQNVVRQGSLF